MNLTASLRLATAVLCLASPSLHHTAQTCAVWEASLDAGGALWECLGAPGVIVRTPPTCKHWGITQGDASQLWECRS